jgi:hypothetical protein
MKISINKRRKEKYFLYADLNKNRKRKRKE